MQSMLTGARRRAPNFLVAAVALALGASSARAQGSYRVIVNPSNPVSTLSKQEASALFLKKKPKWQSGAAVMPVDLSEDAAAREAFSREVLGKPTNAVKAFWQQMIFSGRNVPPPERRTDDEIIAYVRSTPGAIGYVSASAQPSGVKVVTIGG